MVEETKEEASKQKPAESEKKPTPPAPQPAQAQKAAPPVPAKAPAPPVRPPTPPPRPATAPPVPPPRAQPPSTGRRTFMKWLLAIGAFLSIIPFVPWGRFLSSSVSSTGTVSRQKAVADINKGNGTASGQAINVNNLTLFPPNSSWLITYPTSGDLTRDSQNPDTFVKWRVIRLPTELGGGDKNAAAFVAFSEVCVHLWCSPNYDPEHSSNKTDETYQCPCHGSIYRLPDALSIAGPASLQAPPTNAEPMLTLTADPDGSLYVEPAVFDVEHNGVIGYGRDYNSYYTFIKPAAEKGSTG